MRWRILRVLLRGVEVHLVLQQAVVDPLQLVRRGLRVERALVVLRGFGLVGFLLQLIGFLLRALSPLVLVAHEYERGLLQCLELRAQRRVLLFAGLRDCCVRGVLAEGTAVGKRGELRAEIVDSLLQRDEIGVLKIAGTAVIRTRRPGEGEEHE